MAYWFSPPHWLINFSWRVNWPNFWQYNLQVLIHMAQCTSYRYHALSRNTRLVLFFCCQYDIGIVHFWGVGQKSIRRVRIHKIMKKFLGSEVQGFSVDYDHNITAKEINHFRLDDTYMSCLRNQLFLNNLLQTMQLFLQNSRTSYYQK